MRSARTMFVLGVCAAISLPMSWASAKGERGSVRILIPPDGAIVLRHGDAARYAADTGLFEAKWDEPNLGGTLSASADLGTGFKVLLRFGPECPGDVVHQTIYPYVQGGPQVYTPPGEVMCGSEVPEGYYPAVPGLLRLLLRSGLPTAAEAPVAEPSPAGVVAGGGSSGGVGPGGWLALAFLVVIAGTVAALIRAERRTTVIG